MVRQSCARSTKRCRAHSRVDLLPELAGYHLIVDDSFPSKKPESSHSGFGQSRSATLRPARSLNAVPNLLESGWRGCLSIPASQCEVGAVTQHELGATTMEITTVGLAWESGSRSCAHQDGQLEEDGLCLS